MIFLSIRNGLGNQMFILAFGERLKSLYPEHDIIYDDSNIPTVLNGRVMRSLDEIFLHKFIMASDSEIRKYCGRPFYCSRTSRYIMIDKMTRLLNLYKKPGRNVKFIEEPEYWNISDKFIEYIMSLQLSHNNKDLYYFNGFWENIKYLDGLWDELNEIFSFNIRSPKVLELGKHIASEESVSVHVRRGDYLKESCLDTFPHNDYTVCDDKYYYEAMNSVKLRTNKPKFYFFTDDADYVVNKFGNTDNIRIITGNLDYEDLYLMTKCRMSIIANSTFSFWGALLGDKKDLVVAPKLHYVHFEASDLYRKIYFFNNKEWMYIDNDYLNI